jgi:hypothetical protein
MEIVRCEEWRRAHDCFVIWALFLGSQSSVRLDMQNWESDF